MSDINPDFLAGLARLETAGGTKTAGKNNLYNIKDFSGGGTRAYDKAEKSNDAYRDYASPEESTADLVGLLGRKYPNALTAKTPQEFAQALKDGGYATDPNYVQKLTNVIQQGAYDPAAVRAPAAALSSVGAGQTWSELDDFAAHPELLPHGRSTKPVDAEGNRIDLTRQQKKGGVVAAEYGGMPAAVAAIQNPAAAQALGQPEGPIPMQEGEDAFRAAQRVSEAETSTQTAKDAITLREQVGAASLNGNIIGATIRRLSQPEFGPKVPGFQPKAEDIQGKSEDDAKELLAATNQRELDWIKFQQGETENNARIINSKGGWTSFGVQMAAGFGDPLTWVLPWGAARTAKMAGLGSIEAAQAGRGLKAGALAFGENAATNVLQEKLIAETLNEHRSWGDMAGAGLMGILPGVLHGASGWSAAHRIAFAKSVDDAAASVIAKEESYARKAVATLGADATPEQVRAEMDRLQAADIAAPAQSAVGKLPESRRLLPEEARTDGEAPTAPVGEKSDTSLKGNEQTQADYRNRVDRRATDAELKKLGPDATPEQKAAAVRYHDENPLHAADDGASDARRIDNALNPNSETYQNIQSVEGTNYRWGAKQPEGVTVLPNAAERANLRPAVEAIQKLGRELLPGSRIILGTINKLADGSLVSHNAQVNSVGKTHFIGVRENLSPHEAIVSAMHELGHAIWHENARNILPEKLAGMVSEFRQFSDLARKGDKKSNVMARFARYREGSPLNIGKENGTVNGDLINNTNYNINFDEYTAEAFVRFVQQRARDGGITLPEKAAGLLAHAWNKIKELWTKARSLNLLPQDKKFFEFFDDVVNGTVGKDGKAENLSEPQYLAPDLQFDQTAHSAPGPLAPADEVAHRNGLDLLPEDTPQATGEKRALTFLYQRAEEWAKRNPMDEAWMKRAQSLNDNGVFNVASIGLLMLKSKNPVARMLASELMEDAAGVVGHRNQTAAISKYMHERLFLGNSVNDLQSAYDVWKKGQNFPVGDDLIGGRGWDTFNRDIASEIESRRTNQGRTTGTAHPSVIAAADSLEKAYDRMRIAQVRNETLGWAALPESSKGYMPHKMSSTKVRELTNAQTGVLHSALVDQFVSVEGWDISFAANLASKYIDRVKQRALGGYDAPIGIHQTGASDVVQESLDAMGLTRQEVHAQMGRYVAAGPAYTKKRLSLDLNQVHTIDEAGNGFRLLDLFDTNQLHLLRAQAQRVSGEVALARHGVVGKPGLALLRRALGYGADGERATPKEVEAFDQFSSEMLGEPFGNAGGKWLDRARTLNSVARLGGIVFNQFAEFINGIAHVGVGKTLGAIGSIGRLRGEIIALSKGEHVDNPLLTSIEHMTGAEFGTDAYKLQFPFDSLDEHRPTYGRDTIGATDRILRGAGHLQAKISLWRAVHSAQQRGFAEQIVQKAAQFIKSGADDAALNDMGINAGLRERLRADIHNMATFDGDRLTSFDLSKARDVEAAEQFAQSVHRGISQIIQGNFIGEQGKWAHDGYLKMMTQFRSFSILSVEKQWARQRNNQGTAKALGILLGSMSVAVPVYMARTYLSSIGRPDQQEYLEKQLAPFQLTRATMNYVALSGLAGDFLDALTAIAPDAVQEQIGSPTGGRSGTTKTAVGNLVAPAAGYVDDVWGALQNLDKPEKAAKVLPFSRVPFLIPAINALGH